jgi:hypothetical protein
MPRELTDGERDLLEEKRIDEMDAMRELLSESGTCTGCGGTLAWWEEGEEMCWRCGDEVEAMRHPKEVE